MGYLTDLPKESFEKIGLVVVSPRVRHTGWTNIGGQKYQTTFELGVPTGLWETYNAASPAQAFRTANIGSVSPTAFHYDHETKLLTMETFGGDPDSSTLPGVTVEFEVHLSTRPIYGRRDPLSSTFADIVEWEPAITQAPTANNGSQNDIFGFQPVNIANIEIANNGWMNELLYDVSWNLAPIRAYLLVGSDYEKAVQSSGVVMTFYGYVTGISENAKVVSLACSDYTKKLDLKYATRVFALGMGTPDPDAITENPWPIPKLYGAVDGMEPVNIDYADPATTSTNRKWVTHDSELNAAGDLTLTIDHLAANTTTRTYFTTTPGLNVFDQVQLNHGSGVQRVIVTAVNRALKYIDHQIVARTVLAGETAFRPFVANVIIVDRDGTVFTPIYGVDYSTFNDVGQQYMGLLFANNFEASLGLTHTPFNPSRDKVYARVYGTSDLFTYSDATPVGGLSEASGVGADGVSILARVLNAAAIYNDQWDKDTFSAVGADSHTLGVLVPAERGGEPQTYKEVIAQILLSQLWKLGLVLTSTGHVKLGLVAVQPFPSPFDYAVDKTEFLEFSWEQDYADIYSDLVARYKIAKSGATGANPLKTSTLAKESLRAKYVHLVNATYQVDLLQFDESEADTAAAHLMFVLGERRGFYRLRLPYTQLLNAKVGANYQITRDHLPGFAYAFDAENARTLNLIEVQKDLSSVQLVLEDQKGIQDNSGDW